MFIVMEGVDCSGKSTQTELLRDYLFHELQRKVLMTREPGGSYYGNLIKSILNDERHESYKLNPVTKLYLMLADRIEHIQKVITPGIAGGYDIISDRYTPSMWVYQRLEGVAGSFIDSAQAGTYTPVPDLTFVLHLSEEELTKRLRSRAKDRGNDELIEEKLAFLQLANEYYRLGKLSSWQHSGKHIAGQHYIDGDKPAVDIAEEIRGIVGKRIKEEILYRRFDT